MTACWFLHSSSAHFLRNIDICGKIYFLKSTSINTQYSGLWDTLGMMLFTENQIKWKRIGRIGWNFWNWLILKFSLEQDTKRQMLYLSNAPLMNLNSGYSKYAKVARVHYFVYNCTPNISRSADASVSVVLGWFTRA